MYVTVGDIVVCKDFPRNSNDVIADRLLNHSDSNIIIGNSYLVVGVSNHQPSTVISINYPEGLCMLSIIGERGNICYYWSDYFYGKQEVRRMKMEKLNGI